jgi:hypothetical protein
MPQHPDLEAHEQCCHDLGSNDPIPVVAVLNMNSTAHESGDNASTESQGPQTSSSEQPDTPDQAEDTMVQLKIEDIMAQLKIEGNSFSKDQEASYNSTSDDTVLDSSTSSDSSDIPGSIRADFLNDVALHLLRGWLQTCPRSKEIKAGGEHGNIASHTSGNTRDPRASTSAHVDSSRGLTLHQKRKSDNPSPNDEEDDQGTKRRRTFIHGKRNVRTSLGRMTESLTSGTLSDLRPY